MKHLYCLMAFMLSLRGALSSQNPVINYCFTADPTARVFNGKIYMYPSHDIVSPVERLKDWFCMEDYHVYSSENLVDWKDHGVILSQDRVPWVEPKSYAMWAPDCVYKNGKYYFYFPSQPKGQKSFSVGVAVADNPEGPFFPERKPIEGINGIDPCVLNDTDGKSYIYWSGRGLYVAQLKDNMRELSTSPMQIEGLPKGFKEGPFAFRRGDKYYLTFPWVKKKTEVLAYAMSDSPTGPFEFKGIIMDESPTDCWTNHHSIVEYKGQWYLFYHHNDYSPHFDKNRSVRIDSLSFNPDGTICKVRPTLRGVGITDARMKIQVDRYSETSRRGVKVQFIDTENKFDGWKACFTTRGACLKYANVDFGDGTFSQMKLRVKSRKGGTLRIEAGGQVLAEVDIPSDAIKSASESEQQPMVAPYGCDTKTWQTLTVPVSSVPKGANLLRITLAGGSDAEIDWIGFGSVPWSEGAFRTGKYRNVFAEMGYSQAEIDARLEGIFDALFYGSHKIYFETGDSMAYISDIKNNDVRTEGMSYGMMIAVQLDRKEIFDRLWRWSKTYMQHHDGPLKGYFAWSCKTDGTRNSQGPASDGELYYITSLIFASNRWGNDTGIDYLAEAQHILDCSMQKAGMTDVSPLINLSEKLITFTPTRYGARFTDPSYHVPAFYEVWAQWAADGRSLFWRECAARSREYLHRSIHPQTGLNPDYNNYDGSLMKTGGLIGDAFRYDSWRVPMNIALDYSWSCADRDWQQDYADRIQSFLHSQGVETFVDQYNTDGTPVERILPAGGYARVRHSLGLVSTAAAVSLASTRELSHEFVSHMWNSRHDPYDDGYFDAYYDGLLHLFAFMHLSGKYRIIVPTAESDSHR